MSVNKRRSGGSKARREIRQKQFFFDGSPKYSRRSQKKLEFGANRSVEKNCGNFGETPDALKKTSRSVGKTVGIQAKSPDAGKNSGSVGTPVGVLGFLAHEFSGHKASPPRHGQQ